MRIRTALVAAAAVAIAAQSGAVAATRPKPKPLCNLVTDKPGDLTTGTKSLDIVGADIVSDGKRLTVVVRLAKLAAVGSEPTSPTGGYFEFQFTHNGAGQKLFAQITAAGSKFGPGAGAKGAFDLARNEVRITVNANELFGSPVLRQGDLLTNFVVSTDIGNPVYDSGSTLYMAGDVANGYKPYPVGAASCVKLGA
ncbi:MAG TPA: hypothetical protein VF519_15770 [Mycobacteriales bacterium]|jgi:hypothetical protein